jgi:hypothetical protein
MSRGNVLGAALEVERVDRMAETDAHERPV